MSWTLFYLWTNSTVENFQLPSMTCSGTTMRSRHHILPGNRNKFIWKDATLSFLVNYHCIIFIFSGIDIAGITCMTKCPIQCWRHSMILSFFYWHSLLMMTWYFTMYVWVWVAWFLVVARGTMYERILFSWQFYFNRIFRDLEKNQQILLFTVHRFLNYFIFCNYSIICNP